MPRYEVKCWITVAADDEDDAIRAAGEILDLLPQPWPRCTSVEGEGAVYELDEDDE